MQELFNFEVLTEVFSMPCVPFSVLGGPGGNAVLMPNIENDAHGTEKLLLKTQVSEKVLA